MSLLQTDGGTGQGDGLVVRPLREVRPVRNEQASGRYWIGTIPLDGWCVPEELPRGVVYSRGQREQGEGGYDHWQLLVVFGKTVRLSAVRKLYPGHWELTRSSAAVAYVWKEATRVEGSQY